MLEYLLGSLFSSHTGGGGAGHIFRAGGGAEQGCHNVRVTAREKRRLDLLSSFNDRIRQM